jgi:hypothetical protein
VEQGDQSSALLVADRFQVKVLGQGAGLSPDERHELLGAFNLQALAALNPVSAPKALAQAQPNTNMLAALKAARAAANRETAVLTPAA